MLFRALVPRPRPRRFVFAVACALVSLSAACDRHREDNAPDASTRASADSATPDAQDAHVREVIAAGGVVDSILPIAEQLRRFREPLGQAPDSLRGGSASIDQLVRRWSQAIAARDTAALNAMTLDRAEFAWWYYPESKLSKPPYEAPPQLLWSQIQSNSENGARRMFEKFGGRSFQVEAITCPAASDSTARMRAHSDCTVRARTATGAEVSAKLFGSIIEVNGRFKFLGFANGL